MPRVDGLRPDNLPDLLQQQLLKVTPMHGELRPPIARITAPGFLPERLAKLIEVDQFLRFYGQPGHFVGKPQSGQYPNAVGQQVNAYTKRFNTGY